MLSLAKQYPDIAKAWLICSFTLIAMALFESAQSTDVSIISELFGFVGLFLLTGLGMVWLRYFRGPVKICRKPPYARFTIETWGWVSRYLSAYFIGMFALLLGYANAREYGLLQEPSPLLLYFGFHLSYFIASFVMFGVDRKQKLIELAPLISGL